MRLTQQTEAVELVRNIWEASRGGQKYPIRWGASMIDILSEAPFTNMNL